MKKLLGNRKYNIYLHCQISKNSLLVVLEKFLAFSALLYSPVPCTLFICYKPLGLSADPLLFQFVAIYF